MADWVEWPSLFHSPPRNCRGGLGVDFTAVAKACGYAEALTVQTEAETKAALEYLATAEVDGPVMVEIQVKGGARTDLGRPTTTPIENKVAFMRKLGALA